MKSTTPNESAIAALNSAAAVTMVGSVPGVDVWESTAVIRGELPSLPMLPELPARGPGADMVGRTMALLAGVSSEFAVTTTPTGWRLAGHLSSALPGSMRRASAWLGEDLDAAENSFADYSGCYKVQLVGPWTLAACVELPHGDRLLRDRGAVSDLQAALVQASVTFLSTLQRRLPNATFLLQFDEPMVDRVLEGSVPTPSGFSAYSPVERPIAIASLARCVEAVQQWGAIPGIHSCAASAPLGLMQEAGFPFISLDLTTLSQLSRHERDAVDEQFGALFDADRLLFAGLGVDLERRSAPERTLAPLSDLLARLAIDPVTLLGQVVLTPTCGLAGVGTLANVRAVISELSAAGRLLRDERVDIEEGDRR